MEKEHSVVVPLSDEKSSDVLMVNRDQSSLSVLGKVGEKCKNLTLEWEDLHLEVEIKEGFLGRKTSKKVILNKLGGKALPGEVLSIMGPSGGGKTSLLNCLSRRQTFTSGRVYLNGKKLPKNFNKVSAYVMQDDRLFEVLTPRELFQFSANLRLPRTISEKEKKERVEEVIKKLKLQNCADTRVGGKMMRGLSGGERKRTSIGYELITNPSLLFLDEPTSGLDSTTSLFLLKTLKELAEEGHTILCTIHQPSSAIFATFDRLCLLTRGDLAYFGSARDSIDFFSELGYPCPTYTNPSDFFMDLLEVSTEEDKKRTALFVEKSAQGKLLQIEEGNPSEEEKGKGNGKDKRKKMETEKRATFWTQFHELTKRGWITLVRNPITFQARIGQTVVIALLIGFVYFRLDNNQVSINDRLGALFFITTSTVMSSLNGILLTFPLERALLVREQSNGMYGVGSYYLGKFVSSLPLDLVFSGFFAVVVYFIVGLNTSSFSPFFYFLLTIVSLTLSAGSMGLLLGSILPNPEAAVSLAPILIIPFMLFGGFFANLSSIPSWLSWIQYISIFKWGFQMLVLGEFSSGSTFYCKEGQFVEVETEKGSVFVCPITSGEQVLEQQGLGFEDYWIALGVVGAIFVFCRILSFFFLFWQTGRALRKTQT